MIETMTQQQRTALAATLYNIIFTNEVCTDSVFEACAELRKSEWCRGKVKFRLKQVEGELKSYNRLLERSTRKLDFIADINDEFMDLVADDLLRLKMTTLNYMRRCGVPAAELMAKVEVADIFCQGALHNIDFCMSRQSNIQRSVSSMSFLRLTDLCRAYKCLSNEVLKLAKGDYHCDLNESNEIFNGFVIITKKLADPDVIFGILEKIDKEYEQ